jgi:uncharacterized protein (TIRG00374 family)
MLLRGLNDVASDTGSLLRDTRLFAAFAAVTLAILALVALQFWLLTRSIGDGVPLEDAWLAFGVSQMAGMASLLPFGVGVSDGTMAATLASAGLTAEQAFAVAILVRLTVILPLLLLSAASYAFLTLSDSREVKARARLKPESVEASPTRPAA